MARQALTRSFASPTEPAYLHVTPSVNLIPTGRRARVHAPGLYSHVLGAEARYPAGMVAGHDEVDVLRDGGPVEVRTKEARSVLNVRKHADAWFWDRYSVNPYEGCAQACEYCNAVSHRYHKHNDFHRVVYAKVNAATVLRRQVVRKRRDVVAFSGVTEAYQPAERRHRITRQCLEVLLEEGFPVHIITKSHLVLDDLDLLVALHERTAVRVSMTIPTIRPDVSRAIEPRSPSPQRRLDALSTLAEHGLHVGVTAMPLCPLIADHPDDIRALLVAAKDAGARYVLASGMSMHDRQRARWMDFVAERYPQHLPLYRRGRPGTKRLGRVVAGLCREVGIADRMQRPIVAHDPLAANKRVAEALQLRCHALQLRDHPKAQQWIWRKAAWAIDTLTIDIRDIAGAGSLRAIRDVPEEVARFIEATLR